MGIDRRHFLAVSLALGAAPAAALAGAQSGTGFLYLAARKRDGCDEAVVLDEQGRDRLLIAMPARGHSFAIDAPRRRAVVFGRQPGFFAVAFSLDDSAAAQELAVAGQRHFFGHGAYSRDGRLLYATENDYEAGRGVLGIYDAAPGGAYRRIGEFDSGGVGPHEVVLMPDGKTLCVANGGILTHPDYGKLELNLDTMRPSLAYLDAASGQLLERVELASELHRLSIRHLALAADGCIWFGCQYAGPAADRPALVGRHRRGQALELLHAPDEIQRGLRNYVGSVAVDTGGLVAAVSSPLGGQLVYWDTQTGRCLGAAALPDGCGVAGQGAGRFLFSSGQGAILQCGPASGARTVLPAAAGLAWDNHFRRI